MCQQCDPPRLVGIKGLATHMKYKHPKIIAKMLSKPAMSETRGVTSIPLDVQSGLANLSAQIDNRIATLLGEQAKLNEINAELAALEDWKTEIKRLLAPSSSERSSKAGD